MADEPRSLSGSRVARFLERYGFAAVICISYLYAFPHYYPRLIHANELPRVYLTQAMVDEGTFAIDSGVARWGEPRDVSLSDGHLYSNKAPGSSFAAVPAYVVLRTITRVFGQGEPSLDSMVWAFRFSVGIVPSLVFLLLLWRFLTRYAPRPATRRLVVGGYALGTMAMTYSMQFMAHQLAAICIAVSYMMIVRVVEDGKPTSQLMWAGLAAGCAPLVDYQAAFAGIPIAAYLVVKLLQRRDWIGIVKAGIGAMPPIALLLYYHASAFGGALTTGYTKTKYFDANHASGFLGLDSFRWEALFGSTLSPDNGLLFLSPLLLLAIPGWYWLARRRRWAAFSVTLAVCVLYLAFISSLKFWRGGWNVGPRYITALLPFAMIPVAVAADALDRRWWSRAVVVALTSVSVVVYTLSSSVFPHLPDKFDSGVYEVVFRLIGDGFAPYSVGWWIGLRGVWSLLPLFTVVAVGLLWMALPARRYWKSAALGLSLAAVVLVAYSQIPGRGGRCWTIARAQCRATHDKACRQVRHDSCIEAAYRTVKYFMPGR